MVIMVAVFYERVGHGLLMYKISLTKYFIHRNPANIHAKALEKL